MRHVIYYLIVIQHLFGDGVTDSKEEIQTAEGTGTIFVAPSQSGSDIVFSATEASILGSATTSFEDPTFLASLHRAMTSAAIKEPWRCKYCLRLNKQKALRCGTCDSVWQQCYDSYYVHNQNTQRQVAWNYTGWTEEEDESWNYATRSSKSPRRKTGKSPRRPKKNKENSTVPDFDPPWNAKGQPNAPTVTSTDSGAPSGQAEEQLQSLVSKLKEKEAPLSPEEVEHIIAETTTTTVTSKNLNQAARKLDQAREKFQGAQKERRNLHTKWSSYIEESVKR